VPHDAGMPNGLRLLAKQRTASGESATKELAAGSH
jgi:hypothetical protein